MAIHIPPDMIPQDGLECRGQVKLHGPSTGRGWSQYFVIAGTPKEAQVTHILFYGGKGASERWTAFEGPGGGEQR